MSDLQLRRRRAEEAEDAALEQLESELQEEQLENKALAEVMKPPEVQDKTEDLETLPKVLDDEPLGTPTQLAPRAVEPLFTPTQVKELEASQAAASHLYGGPRVLQGLGPVEELSRASRCLRWVGWRLRDQLEELFLRPRSNGCSTSWMWSPR